MHEISDDEEYKSGYIAGFKSVRGDDAEIAEMPATPQIPTGRTPREFGWEQGRVVGLDASIA